MIVSLTKCLIFQVCIIFFHNEIENKLIVFQKLSKNHIDTGHYPDQIFVAEKIIRMIELIFAIEIWIWKPSFDDFLLNLQKLPQV